MAIKKLSKEEIVRSKKREIPIFINDFIDKYSLEGSLETVIKYIQELPKKLIEIYHENEVYKKCHRFEIRIDADCDYYDSTYSDKYVLIGYRWETDIEYQERFNRDNNIKQIELIKKKRNLEAAKKREKTLYENLKKKYGK